MLRTIRGKIQLSSLVLCGVLIAVTWFAYWRQERQMLSMETDYYIEETSLTKEKLDTLFNTVEEYVYQLKKQNDIPSMLGDAGNAGGLEDLAGKMSSLAMTNEDIGTIYLIGTNGYVYSSREGQETVENLRYYQNWLKKYADSSRRSGAWSELHILKNDSFANVVTYFSPIFDTDTRQMYGIIAVDLTYESIQRIFTASSIRLRDRAVILDSEGNIIIQYPLIASYKGISDKYPEILRGDAQIEGVWNKRNTIIVSQQIRAENWNIVRLVPTEAATRTVKGQFYQYTIILLILTAFSAAYSVLLAKSITRPILELSEACDRISRGEITVKAKIRSKNEFGYFAETFNHMLDEINVLFENVKRDEEKKRELENKILLAQVNPHFLYNTLDTIRWLAVMQEVPNIADLSSALINLLKYNLGKTNGPITLEEEVESVRNYLTIQKFRQSAVFHFSTEIDPDALRCTVVPFMLQPLVENSILHGFEDENRTDYIIRITGRIEENLLHICVIDNGKGFDADERNVLNAGKDARFNKLGVNSVRERLRLHYGPRGSLVFSSIENQITTAEIVLPVDPPGLL